MNTRTTIYWATTGLTAASMTAAAGVYFSRSRVMREQFRDLGYPDDYFPPLLGVAKMMGSAALLVPGARVAKEWAYAGFAITFVSAFVSQLARQHWAAALAPVASLAVLAGSYVTRPVDRHVTRAPGQ